MRFRVALPAADPPDNANVRDFDAAQLRSALVLLMRILVIMALTQTVRRDGSSDMRIMARKP